MPQIGWFEILIIVALAILIVGPKDFPIMLKKAGSWISSIKKYFNDIQREVSIYENEDFNDKENKKIETDNEKK